MNYKDRAILVGFITLINLGFFAASNGQTLLPALTFLAAFVFALLFIINGEVL